MRACSNIHQVRVMTAPQSRHLGLCTMRDVILVVCALKLDVVHVQTRVTIERYRSAVQPNRPVSLS